MSEAENKLGKIKSFLNALEIDLQEIRAILRGSKP
jgi:hypothetical protein